MPNVLAKADFQARGNSLTLLMPRGTTGMSGVELGCSEHRAITAMLRLSPWHWAAETLGEGQEVPFLHSTS